WLVGLRIEIWALFQQRLRVIGRSPVDGQGKPYPLLHMQLAR
ncbi:hypothetical protein T5B8_17948, partial [Salinisphaera sp. T5B8]